MIWLGVALAAPTFTGDPEDVELAAAVWDAAVTCTGREGKTAAEVAIVRDLDQGMRSGRASFNAKHGVYELHLATDAPRVLLAHEVGHAWFHQGDDLGIIEGRTELLAECVAAAIPNVVPYLFDSHDTLADVPDIRRWKASSPLMDKEIGAAYAGSVRYFRAVGDVVPLKTVLAEDAMDWDGVVAMLKEAGGDELIAVLEGGRDTQREALSDPDRDGISSVRERRMGTDPEKWDTDGDGWWDSAPADRPPEALPMPIDGTPICPNVRGKGGGEAQFVYGGNMRGFELNYRAATIKGSAIHLLLPEALYGNPGGYWYQIEGDVEPNPMCRTSRRLTLRAFDEASVAHLDALDKALTEAIGEADAMLGPSRHRMLLDVDGDIPLGVGRLPDGALPFVQISPAQLAKMAKKPETLEALADLAVAWHRILDAEGEVPRVDNLPAALATAFSGVPTHKKVQRLYKGDLDKPTATAEACGGWAELLKGCGE